MKGPGPHAQHTLAKDCAAHICAARLLHHPRAAIAPRASLPHVFSITPGLLFCRAHLCRTSSLSPQGCYCAARIFAARLLHHPRAAIALRASSIAVTKSPIVTYPPMLPSPPKRVPGSSSAAARRRTTHPAGPSTCSPQPLPHACPPPSRRRAPSGAAAASARR